MKTKLHILRIGLLASALLLLTGCASIVHNGHREIEVHSSPEGAKFIIKKTNTDVVVATGTTPQTVSLNPRKTYFAGQRYTITFEHPEYKTATTDIKPALSWWYAGNIIFGGLIGLVIVDPLTGAMWDLSPDTLTQSLVPATAASPAAAPPASP